MRCLERLHLLAACLLLTGSQSGCGERVEQQPVMPQAPAESGSTRTAVEVPEQPPGSAANADVPDGDVPRKTNVPPASDAGVRAPTPPTQQPANPATSATAPASAPGAYRGPADSVPKSAGTGGLRGVVRFEGTPPELPPLAVSADHASECGMLDPKSESLLVDGRGGIANVVLTIKVAGKTAEPVRAPSVLEQRSCRFDPHVLLVPAGSSVSFENADVCTATVHTQSAQNAAMNKSIPTGGVEEQTYEKPETFAVANDVHPWMSAWVVVTDAPFHAVTGPDGSFEIQGLPAGPLQLSLWHEKLGQQSQRVDVVGGQVTEVQVLLGSASAPTPPR
jgi:plastocyanin